jgi:hypothetical protein
MLAACGQLDIFLHDFEAKSCKNRVLMKHVRMFLHAPITPSVARLVVGILPGSTPLPLAPRRPWQSR